MGKEAGKLRTTGRGSEKRRVWWDAVAPYVLTSAVFGKLPSEVAGVAANSLDALGS